MKSKRKNIVRDDFYIETAAEIFEVSPDMKMGAELRGFNDCVRLYCWLYPDGYRLQIRRSVAKKNGDVVCHVMSATISAKDILKMAAYVKAGAK